MSVLRDHGFALTETAAEPDGRALETYLDFVVLAPYQHLWFPGDSQG
jgi:amylosucrase